MAACHAVGGSWLADQRRGALAAIFQHLEQIPPLGVGQRREQPIIDRQEIELGQFREQPAIGAVAATDGEVVQEPRRADIRCGEAVATRALTKADASHDLPMPVGPVISR